MLGPHSRRRQSCTWRSTWGWLHVAHWSLICVLTMLGSPCPQLAAEWGGAESLWIAVTYVHASKRSRRGKFHCYNAYPSSCTHASPLMPCAFWLAGNFCTENLWSRPGCGAQQGPWHARLPSRRACMSRWARHRWSLPGRVLADPSRQACN
jgi:hypothetical protein